jgi:hypothetical protein
MAPCLSVVEPHNNKTEVRGALHQSTFNRTDLDFRWMALSYVRTEQ